MTDGENKLDVEVISNSDEFGLKIAVTKLDYEDLLPQKLWTINEAVCVIKGVRKTNDFDYYDKKLKEACESLIKEISRAIAQGQIATDNNTSVQYIESSSTLKWAQRQNYNLPKAVIEHMKHMKNSQGRPTQWGLYENEITERINSSKTLEIYQDEIDHLFEFGKRNNCKYERDSIKTKYRKNQHELNYQKSRRLIGKE